MRTNHYRRLPALVLGSSLFACESDRPVFGDDVSSSGGETFAYTEDSATGRTEEEGGRTEEEGGRTEEEGGRTEEEGGRTEEEGESATTASNPSRTVDNGTKSEIPDDSGNATDAGAQQEVSTFSDDATTQTQSQAGISSSDSAGVTSEEEIGCDGGRITLDGGCVENNESDGPCEPNPCEHGTCNQQGTAYTCACDDGYQGDDCEVEIDECESNPCEHGSCVDSVGGYECDCGDTGYTGERCEMAIQDCANTPCANDGVCTDVGNSRVCDCSGTGFEGESCADDIDDCEAGPCDPLTECTNTPGSYTCSACPSGYTGSGQTACVNINECLVNNGGCDELTVCTDTEGGRTCGACPTGYSGTGDTACNDIDYCLSNNPCRNGGTCIDGITAATCSCVSPWTGTTCGNATLIVNATDRGYYSSFTGLMTDGNTLTGSIGAEWSYRSYFVFPIPSFTGTVNTVTLRLEHELYTSIDVSESFAIFDVSTSVNDLTQFEGDQLDVFDDLGTGNQYGTFTLTPSTVGTVRSAVLTGAVSPVSSARGTDFAIGVSCQSLAELSEQNARFGTGDEVRTHQLQIVVVP